MRKLLCILILNILAINAFSQAQKKAYEKVHAAKISYISDRLHLSKDQAANFWPLYSNFEKERKTLRKKYLNPDGTKNQEEVDAAKLTLEDNIEYQQEELDLKRSYKDQFLKIISAQQLNTLYKSEREFRQLLLQRLRERSFRGGWR